jgi:16S rRNA (cytosine967-C5)-methyltransferase
MNATPFAPRSGAPRPGGGYGGERPAGARGEPQQSTYTGRVKPRLPPMTIRLDQIRQVLDEVLTWRFAADSVVSHWFRAHPKLGVRDRAEVAEVVYDVLRNLRRYRQLAESGVGNAVRRLAIQGAIVMIDNGRVREVLDPGEIAWLDRIAQIDEQSLAVEVRTSLPDWLFERLQHMPNLEQLAQALNQPAALDIRVNPMKAERDEMLADLARGNAVRHAPVATPYSPWGIRLTGRPTMNKWHQFEHGLIEVQDEGSQLLALLVGPKRGEMVIDFCAGAGGKTLLLGALMRSTGRLYALDVSATRLAKAKPRFARSGLSNIVPVVLEHENDTRVRRLAGKAQRVLVDAPCSGVGTLRRNPDLKWRQSVQSLQELTALQARILASASRCVAPGGRLVYATCSVLIEENQAQAERFLAEHPDFELIDAAQLLSARTSLQLEGPYLNLRPDVHGTDGFFAAVFERRKAGGAVAPEADVAAIEVKVAAMGKVAAEGEVATQGKVAAEGKGATKAKGATQAKIANEAQGANEAQVALEADSTETAEGSEIAQAPKKAVKAKPRKQPDPAEPADAVTSADAPDSTKTVKSVKAVKSVKSVKSVESAVAPASAIDAFAAFLAKDALNPAHQDEAEAEDSKADKPAKKPRASKAAVRVKKA